MLSKINGDEKSKANTEGVGRYYLKENIRIINVLMHVTDSLILLNSLIIFLLIIQTLKAVSHIVNYFLQNFGYKIWMTFINNKMF